MPGELTFKPLQLELQQQSFKQDPYVYARLGDSEAKTGRGQSIGGNSYSWEKANTLQFYNKSEPSLKLVIRDADKKEPDDQIGDVKVDLDILESSKEQKTWFDVYQKGKVIGRLLLEGSYQPDKGVGIQNQHGTAIKPEFNDQSHHYSQ